jgi:hypothetical protein
MVKIFRGILLTISLFFGLYFSWQYTEGNLERNTAQFVISIIASIFFFSEFIVSLSTKEVVAKGIIISKDKFPLLYYLLLFAILTLFIISGIGVYAFR